MIVANATDHPTSAAGPLSQRHKSVLFCPACGSEHTTEEGLVTTHPDGADIYCPDCLSFLTRRGH
jgi:predicted RNA-binding Zn-ribbon protein involved in translation (DUF1610 family)